jgi:coenzyme PQQ precursor peptide PqqA
LRRLRARDKSAQIEPVGEKTGREAYAKQLEEPMAWTTPTIVEVCVGMEITAYESAEI